MLPLFDCIGRLVGWEGPEREKVDRALEIAPLAYLRGRTFDDAVCIFDEAQNASFMQLKLFLTRFGENSKIIITGDPTQSDLQGAVALVEVVEKLKTEPISRCRVAKSINKSLPDPPDPLIIAIFFIWQYIY